MIGFLKGIVESKDSAYLLIDVSGVGYRVLPTSSVFKQAILGKPLKVYTYTHVKEDALDLYGFSNTNDLRLFELLIGVSGIGPKTALGIFSIGSSDQIIGAVQKADADFFTTVPRLGRKNAQKIIIELKNKLGGIGELDLSSDGESDEVVVALKTFGFTTQEITTALRNVKGKTTEEKIKQALKQLGR